MCASCICFTYASSCKQGMKQSCACDSVCDTQIGKMALMIAIASVVAGGVAIWGSVLGCKVICCCRSTNTVGLSIVIISLNDCKSLLFFIRTHVLKIIKTRHFCRQQNVERPVQKMTVIAHNCLQKVGKYHAGM